MSKQFLAAASAFVVLMLGAPAMAEETPEHQKRLQEATAELHSKHFAKAYHHFHALASHGCLTSQCIVGLMHQHGVGVPKDGKQALQWFQKAANQDLAEAQYELGRMYLNGNSIEQDAAKARYWLTRASDHGMTEAKDELSKLVNAPIPNAAPTDASPAQSGMENVQRAWQGYSDVAQQLAGLDREVSAR